MELYEAIAKRHSVRKFVPSEIGDDTLLRIADAGRNAPSGCNIQNREYILIRDRAILDQFHERIQPDFHNAAAAIALVMTPKGTPWGEYWIEDAAAGTQNMLLAIVAEGYDSVWIEGTLRKHEEWAKELLGIPAGKRLYILLPIGKAAKNSERAPKAPLDEVVHYDRYRA